MKILVVEDDNEIARIVKAGLESAGFHVDVARDGMASLALIHRQDPQGESYAAAVVDLMLPGMDGLTLIQRLREALTNLPVLILSAKRSVDERIAGLQAGGDDYLTKPFVFAELLARLQALLRRTVKTSETSLTSGGVVLDLISRELRQGAKSISLQPKEFSLLELFMRRQNQVISKAQILKHVWDYDFDPQTNVVDVLVCRLRNKIDSDLQTKMIETIRGVGYVLKSP